MNRLLRLALSIALAPPLYALLALLGLISLVWNLVAMLLYPVMPAEAGRALGRRVIAYAYRAFWASASLCGMMRIEANCLDALRNERGLIFVANHPTMLDALLLVGASGFSYEEAAAICECAVGTIKSRVNRARTRLAELLAIDGADDFGPDQSTRAILSASGRG